MDGQKHSFWQMFLLGGTNFVSLFFPIRRGLSPHYSLAVYSSTYPSFWWDLLTWNIFPKAYRASFLSCPQGMWNLIDCWSAIVIYIQEGLSCPPLGFSFQTSWLCFLKRITSCLLCIVSPNYFIKLLYISFWLWSSSLQCLQPSLYKLDKFCPHSLIHFNDNVKRSKPCPQRNSVEHLPSWTVSC